MSGIARNTSFSGRACGVPVAVAATTMLLALTLLVTPARAATAPDLSGIWLNSGDTASDYKLVASPDRQTLEARWSGTGAHSELRGVFDGALNSAGTEYSGPFKVVEGSVTVNGTGTFAISSFKHDGYPFLDVKLQGDNGTVTDIVLEIWMPQPRVVPGPLPAAAVQVNCDSPGSCFGTGFISPLGSQLRPAARSPILGSAPFKIAAGKSKTLKIKLNKRGRAVLAKHGTLKVRIVVKFTKAKGLAHNVTLGTVTFHKH
jgi:hypothetical protein